MKPKTKHTPGPWIFGKSPKIGYNVYDKSQNWISKVNDLGNGLENAKLIIAAPALLKAAKMAVASLKLNHVETTAIFYCEEAISKAEGRER